MMDFEDQLRSALARQEPPPDFTAKVLARAARREGGASKRWAVACIAASLVLGGFGAVRLRSEIERERERSAHAQLMQALQITSSQLHRIEKKVDGLNR